MADNVRDHKGQSARVREIIKRARERTRPRTLEEMKNAGRGSRDHMKANLRKRAMKMTHKKKVRSQKRVRCIVKSDSDDGNK
jgi:hypothetical protein